MLTTEINNHILYNYLLYLKKTYPNKNIKIWYSHGSTFIRYLNMINILYNCINKSLIKQYIEYVITKEEKKLGYVNNLISGLRTFYKYLYENKFINRSKYHECYLVKISNNSRQHGTVITIEDLDDLIKNIILYSNIKNPYRIKTILYFMFYTGITNQEIVKLKRININLERRSVNIKETGKYLPRIVYFPEIVKELLIKYFESEKENINTFNTTVIELNHIGNRLRQYKIRGISFTFVLLRRSFIKMLIKNNLDAPTIARLSGIRDISYIFPYLEFSETKMEKLYKKYIKHNGKVGK